jgi:hypothetical protein
MYSTFLRVGLLRLLFNSYDLFGLLMCAIPLAILYLDSVERRKQKEVAHRPPAKINMNTTPRRPTPCRQRPYSYWAPSPLQVFEAEQAEKKEKRALEAKKLAFEEKKFMIQHEQEIMRIYQSYA